MKKYLLPILLLLFSQSNAQISICNPTGTGITTNPAAPVNTQRPSKLNNFNWTLSSYPINLLYN